MKNPVPRFVSRGDFVSQHGLSANFLRKKPVGRCDACGATGRLVAVDDVMVVCTPCFVIAAADTDRYLTERFQADGRTPQWLEEEEVV